MRSLLFITLTLSLGSAYAVEAPEFDFSFDEPAEEDVGLGFPLRGKLAFDLGYQFGSPERWQTIGPSAQLIFDWNGDWNGGWSGNAGNTNIGQIYSELTTRYNHAYTLESDSQTVIDKYRINDCVREFYWKRAFGEYSITLGRTIISWGKANLLPVVDVVSPSDSSSLLFAKPEELRLGQDLFKFDWYRGNSEFNFIYTPKARYNLNTDYGHPYSMMPPFVSDNIDDNNSEWGVRWSNISDKLEYGLIAGEFSQRDPLVVGTELSYIKSNMAGANIIYSRAPFLWKGEFLLIEDSPYQKLDYSGYESIDTLKGTIGFDYASSNYGSWIVEYGGALTSSEPPISIVGGSTGVVGISWSNQYLRDDLSINAAMMLIGGTENHLLRLGGSYKLDDDWTTTSLLTLINADSSEPIYQIMRGFDRFDLSIEYGFDLSQ